MIAKCKSFDETSSVSIIFERALLAETSDVAPLNWPQGERELFDRALVREHFFHRRKYKRARRTAAVIYSAFSRKLRVNARQKLPKALNTGTGEPIQSRRVMNDCAPRSGRKTPTFARRRRKNRMNLFIECAALINEITQAKHLFFFFSFFRPFNQLCTPVKGSLFN